MNKVLPHISIVFFDGYCGLCNRSIDFLIIRDKKHVLKYAPLQGLTSKKTLLDLDPNELESIIYLRNGEVHIKSKAVLLILKDLGLPWSLAYGLNIFPRFMQNFVYDFIAQNRFAWFGKRETCRLPKKSEEGLFLD